MIGRDGTIYQQEQQTSIVYALSDKGDRAEIKWKYDPVEPGDAPKLAAVDSDTLYLATNPATMDSLPVFTALSLNGELKWFRPFPGAYQGTSPVVTANAVVFWTAEQGERTVRAIENGAQGTPPSMVKSSGRGTFLYALDKSNGDIIWKRQASDHSQSGESEVVAPDGTIYMSLQLPSPQGDMATVIALHESATSQELSASTTEPGDTKVP